MSSSFRVKKNVAGVVFEVGETFYLELDENPTTGYRWFVDVSPSQCVTQVSDDYAVIGDNVGGGGLRRFLMQALHPGPFTIVMRCCRDWEVPTVPVQTYTITGLIT